MTEGERKKLIEIKYELEEALTKLKKLLDLKKKIQRHKNN